MLGEEYREKDHGLFEKSLRHLTDYNKRPNAWEQKKFPILVEAMEYLQSCARKNAADRATILANSHVLLGLIKAFKANDLRARNTAFVVLYHLITEDTKQKQSTTEPREEAKEQKEDTVAPTTEVTADNVLKHPQFVQYCCGSFQDACSEKIAADKQGLRAVRSASHWTWMVQSTIVIVAALAQYPSNLNTIKASQILSKLPGLLGSPWDPGTQETALQLVACLADNHLELQNEMFSVGITAAIQLLLKNEDVQLQRKAALTLAAIAKQSPNNQLSIASTSLVTLKNMVMSVSPDSQYCALQVLCALGQRHANTANILAQAKKLTQSHDPKVKKSAGVLVDCLELSKPAPRYSISFTVTNDGAVVTGAPAPHS